MFYFYVVNYQAAVGLSIFLLETIVTYLPSIKIVFVCISDITVRGL